MKNYNKLSPLRMKARKGLTLIELLVVLTILVAVGSLLVPTIGKALTRSHLGTCSASIPEIHSMMQRMAFDGGGFGDNFETGVNVAGVSVNGYAVDTLTADEVSALSAVGIQNIVEHDETAADYNITFNPGTAPVAIDATTPFIVIDDASTNYGLYLPTDSGEKYAVLFIGRDWTGIPDLAPEPPVHFGDTPGALPDDVHSRFAVVFQVSEVTDFGDDGVLGGTGVDADTVEALEAAEFKTVSVAIGGGVMETRDNHTEVYWSEINND